MGISMGTPALWEVSSTSGQDSLVHNIILSVMNSSQWFPIPKSGISSTETTMNGDFWHNLINNCHDQSTRLDDDDGIALTFHNNLLSNAQLHAQSHEPNPMNPTPLTQSCEPDPAAPDPPFLILSLVDGGQAAMLTLNLA